MAAKQIEIRDAGVGDIADLALLMTDLSYPTSVMEMEKRFMLIHQHADYKTIVAVAGGEIVGMAGLCKGIFYELDGLYMRILALVVKQNSRSLGIGKLLLTAAEAWAVEQKLGTILVNSGNREERIVAHRFYEAMGYAVKSSGFVKKL